jgi:biopolymer transport protein ExbB
MVDNQQALVERIMALPVLQAEWVLWFLFALSALSLAIIGERALFFARRRVDFEGLCAGLGQLDLREPQSFHARLGVDDSLEARVLSRALGGALRGPDAVEEIVRAALSRERQRYERGLALLAIVGSNAPFIGLFGTVLGIIHAFQKLSLASADSSKLVMAGVSEALVATAVGLLVAIPAVSAFNYFKARLKARVERADQLVRALLAELKSDTHALSERENVAA